MAMMMMIMVTLLRMMIMVMLMVMMIMVMLMLMLLLMMMIMVMMMMMIMVMLLMLMMMMMMIMVMMMMMMIMVMLLMDAGRPQQILFIQVPVAWESNARVPDPTIVYANWLLVARTGLKVTLSRGAIDSYEVFRPRRNLINTVWSTPLVEQVVDELVNKLGEHDNYISVA